MSNNKTFYRLLDTLKNTAVTAGSVVLGGAYLAEQKAEAVWSNLKLRHRASRLEDEISERLQEVGKLVYATHAGIPSDSEEMHGVLREIDHMKSQLDTLNEQIGRKPEGLSCPFCGAEVQPEDRFCRECGEGLFEEDGEEPEEVEENEDEPEEAESGEETPQ